MIWILAALVAFALIVCMASVVLIASETFERLRMLERVVDGVIQREDTNE